MIQKFSQYKLILLFILKKNKTQLGHRSTDGVLRGISFS
jgi:hypothetical protein